MVHRNAPLSETGWLRLARWVVEADWTLQPEVDAPSSWDIRVTSWQAHSAAMSSTRLTFDTAPQSTPRLLQERDALSLLGHLRPLPTSLLLGTTALRPTTLTSCARIARAYTS